MWANEYSRISMPELPFSNVWCITKFLGIIPKDSLLHVSILNSERISNYVKFPEDIKVYCNLSTHGIDGPLSTFLGQSYATDKPAFLIIGDLSFFYDMNALGIRHIKNNVHILVINNYGGGEMYMSVGKDINPNIDLHTSAKHNKSVKAWVVDMGFDYIAAKNKDEFDANINNFVSIDNKKPIVMECFTDMDIDAKAVYDFYAYNQTGKDKLEKAARNVVRKVFGK
jgi:2-succinyl-5-enolpyruvyl-6-hydroxy-3-cyclohexene-1-carboxylate synthase